MRPYRQHETAAKRRCGKVSKSLAAKQSTISGSRKRIRAAAMLGGKVAEQWEFEHYLPEKL